MSSDRDLKMGRALASIPLPELPDEYYSRLAENLEQALSGSSRVPRRSRMLRIGLVAAAVAAAAAVLAFAVLPALRGTDTATAADMLASMKAAGGAQTVHIRLIQTERLGNPAGDGAAQSRRIMTEDLVLSVTGDFRGKEWYADDEGLATPVFSDFGYDAARRELRVASEGNSDGVLLLHPAWPTDLPIVTPDYLGYEAAASSVRALLAELDPTTPVTETTYLGRPAWQATLRGVFRDSPAVTVTVDKATGLLLETRRSGTANGKAFLAVLRVTRFETDPSLDAGWQVVPLLKKPTAGLKWNYIRDEGTRFGSPEAVAARSWPTLPLIPEWVPSGYGRTDVANAVYQDVRREHMEDNSWHWSTDIVRRPGRLPGLGITKRLALKRCAQGVLVLFRRGFQSFTVEISPRLPGEPGLGKLAPESRMTAQDTVLTGGYLKGARARTWISTAMLPVTHPWGNSMFVWEQGPTLLAYSDRSLVAIYGDLTRQELIDVANSLRVYGDTERPLPEGYGQ